MSPHHPSNATLISHPEALYLLSFPETNPCMHSLLVCVCFPHWASEDKEPPLACSLWSPQCLELLPTYSNIHNGIAYYYSWTSMLGPRMTTWEPTPISKNLGNKDWLHGQVIHAAAHDPKIRSALPLN